MDSMTYYCLTSCEAKVVDILRDIVACGFGSFSITIEESRDFKTRIVIMAGRSYVFFVPKKMIDDGIF